MKLRIGGRRASRELNPQRKRHDPCPDARPGERRAAPCQGSPLHL